jgi:hypothetical protein
LNGGVPCTASQAAFHFFFNEKNAGPPLFSV